MNKIEVRKDTLSVRTGKAVLEQKLLSSSHMLQSVCPSFSRLSLNLPFFLLCIPHV